MTARPPPPVRCLACRATLYPAPGLPAAGVAAITCGRAVCPVRGDEPALRMVVLTPGGEERGRLVEEWNAAVRGRKT